MIRKLWTDIPQQRCKNPLQIFSKLIQQYKKGTIYLDQVEFFIGAQGCFNIHKSINAIYHINRIQKKNYTTFLTDTE